MSKKPESKNPKKRALLATGGGNATASGVSFQASVAAYFAAQGLSEVPLDARLGLGSANPTGFRFETEVPVDDILISLDTTGWIFVQAKNSLTNSALLTSELGKTCDEFARLWEAAAPNLGSHGWDRKLISGVDAMVIAVGPTTSGTIKHHLAAALDVGRGGSSETLSTKQKDALDGFRVLLGKALAARGGATANVDPNTILKFIHVIEFDFGGAHRTTAEAVLANALTDRSVAPAALTVLEKEFDRRMAARNGISLDSLRSEMSRSGVPLNAPVDFRPDTNALRDRSAKVAEALEDFEKTQVSGKKINVARACTAASIAAAKEGSLVIVGDPGAGKSAAINDTARQLQSEGYDVVLLAVDRLQVESAEGLSSALGITHSLSEVLSNWPGSDPAFLILDALDACRFGRSEAVFRTVMQEVAGLEDGRWRVVASIRTFDLMMGQEFEQLFRGIPPNSQFMDPRFQKARHIKVPDWSDAEFEELLNELPALRGAIDNGGPKLAELARTPFNTRLLADLLTDGVVPEHLRNISSQVELLEMYWKERVRPLGLPAEQCLYNTVNAMVDHGRMEATRIVAGAGTNDALDQLLQRGVLISVNADRKVAFRHHLLFDYVASRTIVEIEDSAKINELLKRNGAGLLLAPALTFALQHLWETSGPGRESFWQEVVNLAGSDTADPIARSVSARVGCDLPSEADETAGLALLMGQSSKREKAFNAFSHIVGSLSVRLEDEKDVATAPWASLAESVAPYVTEIAWPLRTLIHSLIDVVTDTAMHRQIGVAARAVMNYAFNGKGGKALMPVAIDFIAKTFDTEPGASRKLVERLLEPSRMEENAANDMHWLANAVPVFADYDPDLVVQVYDRIFAHTVKEDTRTSLGNSKILPLTSNSRQDFQMSQWALKEAFPDFADKYPLAAAEAAIKISAGYIQNEHKLSDSAKTSVITIDDQTGAITQDYSHIWAPENRDRHHDDAVKIIEIFVDFMKRCSDSDAVQIGDRLIAENQHAWLWNRLLMVANERGGVLAAKLWPWAAQIGLLRTIDTMQPAITLLASQYGQRSSTERQELEEAVLAATFPDANKPSDSAQYFKRRVFCAIGRDTLETLAAKDIVDNAISTDSVVLNSNLDHFYDPDPIEHDDYWWLREKGVDITLEPNASLLGGVSESERLLSEEKPNVAAMLIQIRSQHDKLISAGSKVHPLVITHGWERASWTIMKLTTPRKVVSELAGAQRTEIEDLLVSMRQFLLSLSATGEDFQKPACQNIAASIMNIVRSEPEAAARFGKEIRSFAHDHDPGVRGEIAARIDYLWNTNQTLMWELAESFVGSETDTRVLAQLVSFLTRASNDEPERVCALTQTLLQRSNFEQCDGRDVFRKNIGALVFHLWTRHGQAPAREIIDGWLMHRVTFKIELQHGASSLREGLVVGYDNDNALDHETRTRCQNLAYQVIDVAACGIEKYIALNRVEQTDARNAEVGEDASLLDQLSQQFYFAIGASEVRKGEEPRALGELECRGRYLSDNEKTFRRVGDVGTPKTIYHMLQLFDFLAQGNWALVFDLTSHALLSGGKMHGYQYETLGATQFVTMIGQTIADHRELFDDPARQLALVEVLEAFVKAGWPDARRLLYRLPEALR